MDKIETNRNEIEHPSFDKWLLFFLANRYINEKIVIYYTPNTSILLWFMNVDLYKLRLYERIIVDDHWWSVNINQFES